MGKPIPESEPPDYADAFEPSSHVPASASPYHRHSVPTHGSWIQTSPHLPARPVPPPDAQKALAPLTLTGGQVKGTFEVDVSPLKVSESSSKSQDDTKSALGAFQAFSTFLTQTFNAIAVSKPVDVRIEQNGLESNRKVEVILFFKGSLQERPIRIVLASGAGSVRLAIPDKRDGQRYDINVAASGPVVVLLPLAYDGMLSIRTDGHGAAQTRLGPKVSRNSTLHPSPPGSDTRATHWRIRPVGPTADDYDEEAGDTAASAGSTSSPPGMDTCEIVSTRSDSVLVDYYGEQPLKTPDSQCILA